MTFPQRVLIVDDDPIQRAVLTQVFNSHGATRVAAAADGLVAISTIENAAEPFELIVLDLMMPEYDGIELISYLESKNARAALLLISGLPQRVVEMSNTLAEASGLRSIGTLQKPIVLKDLLAIVEGQRWHRRQGAKREYEKAVQVGQL